MRTHPNYDDIWSEDGFDATLVGHPIFKNNAEKVLFIFMALLLCLIVITISPVILIIRMYEYIKEKT